MNDTPLISALEEYIKKNKLPMHMPGHKQGKLIPDELKKILFDIDLTELKETDNLHEPKGPLKEAQRKLSQTYASKKSYFLINGSSCGINASISAICNPDDELIVDRNCHSSVIAGLIHTGVKPVYIYSSIVNRLQICGGTSALEIEEAILKHPKSKGVIITYPTYYGICSDIVKISKIVHKYNKILLVDEAHGAHLNFCEKLPISALKAGADICVQSAHKTLPALTQSAFLHVGTNRINIDRLQKCLKIYQSTSPSYILMALLDYSRSYMNNEGREKLEELVDLSYKFRNEVNKSNLFYCAGDELIGNNGINDFDTTRIVINFKKLFMTGYEIADILNRDYNIQVEMADINNIICILTVVDDRDTISMLKKALQSIYTNCYSRLNHIPILENICLESVITPREAFYSELEDIEFKKSKGRICGSIVISYPPGVPLICPGERISEEVLEQIKAVVCLGGSIIGLKGNNIDVMKE